MALGVLSLAVGFLLINVQAIHRQRTAMEHFLTVSRLAKEASQRVANGQSSARVSRDGYTAQANRQRVTVKQGNQLVLEVVP